MPAARRRHLPSSFFGLPSERNRLKKTNALHISGGTGGFNR
jgi:hypothetical protein